MTLTSIPTHKEWTKLRDAAGGKSNMVSGVNIGKLLDTYWNSAGKGTSTQAMVNQVKHITPLINGFKKYRAAVAKTHPKVAALCDDIIKLIELKIKQGAEIANPVIKLRQYLEKVVEQSTKLMQSGDLVAYDTMWGGVVRGVGTSLAPLSKDDPKMAKMREVWLKYTSAKWNVATVAPKALSADERAAKIKEAAKALQRLAVDTQQELKSMHVIS